MKKCPACEKEKSDLHFAVDRHHADGLNRLCRDCDSDYQRDRRIKLRIAGKSAHRPHLYIPPGSF